MKENEKTLATIRKLSDRLVEAQRSIRILDAVKWDDEIRRQFFESNCKELPAIDRACYANRDVGFNIEDKLSELLDIELDAKRLLGEFNSVGKIIRRIALEYADAVRMI